MSEDGLVSVRSALSAWDTIARIEAELAAKGVTIFAKIDHAAGAAAAGDIASDHLDHFWQCKGVAPLMQACQRAGIDLPLKALVRGRYGLADLQRSSLARPKARAWPVHRTGYQRHVGNARRTYTACNRSRSGLIALPSGGQQRSCCPLKMPCITSIERTRLVSFANKNWGGVTCATFWLCCLPFLLCR
jgi:hypothetical protein